MRKTLIALMIAAGLAGCNSTSSQDRGLVGSAVGAGTGAVIAAAAGANAGETVAAAAGGAIVGAIVGIATTPTGQCTDQFGRILPPGQYRDPSGRIYNCA